ncbi:hypothetical protein GCM10023080_084580 [Streptomyces pseudoechinosporeus]
MKSSARDGDSDDGVLGAGRGAAGGAASDAAELPDRDILRPYAGDLRRALPESTGRFRTSSDYDRVPTRVAAQAHSLRPIRTSRALIIFLEKSVDFPLRACLTCGFRQFRTDIRASDGRVGARLAR